MADTRTLPGRRSPLDSAWTPGVHGSPTAGGPGVTFTRRLGLSALQFDARAGRSAAVGQAVADTIGVALPTAGRAASGAGIRALWIGPDRWLLLAADGSGLEERLQSAAVPAGGVVVDQGHGRAIVRVEGPRARDVLAKGTGIDLHPRAFAEDSVAQTGMFHLSVTIDRRRGTACFDIHAMRGFALSLHESLCEAAGEYGYRLS